MCGIGAVLAPPGHPALGSIGAMMNAVRHRGPDGEGYALFGASSAGPQLLGGADTPAEYYGFQSPSAPQRAFDGEVPTDTWLALGHRRLSIVDLSPGGHQPMGRGRCWIAYNGEVYNHVELRAELEALGHSFRSRSDTEVILAAYEQWGTDCPNRFNGMFAFLICDPTRGTLFAARDRFGVKPLYYWIAPDGFVAFASEIKQFAVLPGWQARINGQRAYDFLNWSLLDHSDETLFRGVHQLRNGEALSLNVADVRAGRRVSSIAPGRWYTLGDSAFAGSLSEAAGKFRNLLTESVRLRLRADVPVGSCLSGGLDSSSIVCVMNDLLTAQNADGLQQTFSACSPIARFDERTYIEDVVAATAVQAHYVYPEVETLFAELDDLTWHQDEPFGSSSIYAQWCVFRLAAEHGVKVMLDGQGADEQLGGYHPYFGLRLAGLARGGRLGALVRESLALRRLHRYGFAWSAKQLMNVTLPESLRQPLRAIAGKPSVLDPPWLDMRLLGAEPSDPFLEPQHGKHTSVEALSRAQLTRTNLQMLLHWEDRDSMAHSIESRVPFLDYRLVEFVLGLPESFKLSDGVTKQVLREAMRGLLPERVRNRMDKLGFVTAEEVWTKQTAAHQFSDALDRAIAISGGILQPRLHSLLKDIQSGVRPFDQTIWRAISFGAWMRRFAVDL